MTPLTHFLLILGGIAVVTLTAFCSHIISRFFMRRILAILYPEKR